MNQDFSDQTIEQVKKEQEELEEKEKQILKKENGEKIKQIINILLADKTKIKSKKLAKKVEDEIILVIDMLANVVQSSDKDAINYAFVAYKYMVKSYKLTFFRRAKKIGKLIEDVVGVL